MPTRKRTPRTRTPHEEAILDLLELLYKHYPKEYISEKDTPKLAKYSLIIGEAQARRRVQVAPALPASHTDAGYPRYMITIKGIELLTLLRLGDRVVEMRDSSLRLERFTKALLLLTAMLVSVNLPLIAEALKNLQCTAYPTYCSQPLWNAVYYWISLVSLFLVLCVIVYYLWPRKKK